MYLLTQSKNGLSAMALGRQLGVSYNTAWSLKHKLMQVMKERDESGRLGHIVQVDDAYLGGETRGGKRGPRGGGQDAVRGGRAGHRRRPAGGVADELRERVPQAGDCGLGPTGICGGRRWSTRTDWPASRGVEEAGCEHRPRVTGGGPGSCEASGLGWVNTVLGNVKRALDGTYHAWGQKYAPRYLAEFSYRFNRRYQLADLVPRLAHVAVQTPPLPYRLLTVAGTYA